MASDTRTNKSTLSRFDILLLSGIIIFLATLLYSLREILSPPVLTFLLIVLLLPLRKQSVRNILIFVTLFVFLLWFIKHAGNILFPFILSILLAYLFDPFVGKLEKLKIPRTISIIIIVLVVIGLLTLGLIFVIPQLISEIKDLIDQSIVYSYEIANWVAKDGLTFLEQFHIETSKIEELALQEMPARFQQILQAFFKGALNLTSALSTALGQLVNLLLIPFLFFYLLKDFDRMKTWIKDLIPVNQSIQIENYATRINNVLSGYFRGQLIVCSIVAILTSLGLLVLGIPYAMLLGIMAGVLNLVPYIGLAITLLFGLLVGIFSPSPLLTCVKIIAIIETVQILEGSFLSPRIVGQRVGLHPVWVMFAVLVFAQFGGFLGLLIAIPCTAIIKIFVTNWIGEYQRSNQETVATEMT